MIRLILLAVFVTGLSACGFRPLYAGAGFDGVVEGQSIEVAEIPGRSGYSLRRQLIQQLAVGLPGVEGPARLTVVLDEGLTRAALLPDGAVSRSFKDARGEYILETSNGPVEGEVSVQVPYTATNTPYTDVSAQIDATERAMTELSRQIVESLRIQAQQNQ